MTLSQAEVAFAAGAFSWHASQELRDRILSAVDKTAAPIMLLYAANDFDTTPGKDVAEELDRLHKSHVLKIYPAIGKTSEDGHNLLYLGIPEWEPDVFQFLDENVKHCSNQLELMGVPRPIQRATSKARFQKRYRSRSDLRSRRERKSRHPGAMT